jgi:hypothetical protein
LGAIWLQLKLHAQFHLIKYRLPGGVCQALVGLRLFPHPAQARVFPQPNFL